MSALPPFFTGPERLERWALARKITRIGTPEALSVGDLDRALEHVRAGRADQALAYVDYVHPGHLGMAQVVLEWCVRLVDELARRRGEDEALRWADEASALWTDGLAGDTSATPLHPTLVERLSSGWLGPHRAAYLRRRRDKTLALPEPDLVAELEARRALVAPAIGEGPEDIPDRYFERLGLTKDPSRFRRVGGVMGQLKALAGLARVVLGARR